MTAYILDLPEVGDVKDLLNKVDNMLGGVEVKGESVGQLWTARVILKQIFDSLKPLEEKKE